MAQGIQDLQWQRSYNLMRFTQYSTLTTVWEVFAYTEIVM